MRALTFFLLTLIGVHQSVDATKYRQTYTWTRQTAPDGTTYDVPYWSPSGGPQIEGVVPFYGAGGVELFYNCYYTQEICENFNQFNLSARGTARRNANIANMFGYDFGSALRNSGRRRESCRTGNGPYDWKAKHICPEPGDGNLNPAQSRPWKQDVQWYTTALENPFPATQVRNRNYTLKTDNRNGMMNPAWISYTCDEFPSASWVEGGTGLDANDPLQGPSNTRCTGQSCMDTGAPEGTRSEQNWQGIAMRALRFVLLGIASSRTSNNVAVYPGWTVGPNNDISGNFVMFKVTVGNNPGDGVPAKVITWTNYRDANPSNVQNTNQRKRSHPGESNLEWFNRVTHEELRATFDSHEIHIREVADVDNPDGDVRIVRRLATPRLHGSDEVPEEERTPLIKRVSGLDIEKARAVVEAALAKTALLNAARYANPLRNKYELRPGTVTKRSEEPDTPVPPLLEITDDIAKAAALVAEADAAAAGAKPVKRAVGSYWMESIARKGSVPFGNDASYKVFRNIRDYGAVGDGVTDDTAAIKNAMTDGNRCGKGCNGSTLKNAIVYFPPGKYLVSTTIPMPFGTQVIGDANSWPTVIASKTFIGLGVLSTDEYTGGGLGTDGLDQEYYINTANFYRQIRNMRIDVTQTRSASQVAGLHYQVAQASSIQNVELIANSATKQRGIFAENGSGGVMSDITFTGGAFGLYGGNQQFTSTRLTFNGCATGVQVIWDWGWVWKSITMNNVDVGFRLLRENTTSSGASKRQANGKAFYGNIGSAAFMDSTFTNVNTAVLIAPPNSKPGSGSTGVVVENCAFSSVKAAVADTSGNTILPASAKVDSWTLGPVYSPSRTFASGSKVGNYTRQAGLLDSNGKYYERAKPQYESRAVADFVHVKDLGAKGDGSTDDTAAFQSALNQAASQGKILFVDAGSYILTNTITVPPGSKIVGELWSQLVASGSYFADASNPKVMIKVGNAGDVGSVEMQDLLFTNRGATAGLIMVEWNIRASSNGAAALWDCHARIGGALGTQLTPKECPASTTGTNSAAACNAGSLMMHITSSGSGYFDNMWLWVADHMIDDPDTNDTNNTMTQISIYVARGLLVESTNPTFLYGTASEHSVFYQYNFNKARNIFAGLLQTESPYYQPVPKPPAPYASASKMSGDPTYTCAANDEFSGCDQSWAVIVQQSSNVFVAGAGLYSWFSSYTQDCIDNQTCQKALVLLKNNLSGVRFQNLITIGAKYMIVQDGVGIKAIDNLNVNVHPSWSQISVYDVTGAGGVLWLDPKVWQMDQPQFTCIPPCTIKVPPWTGATQTVRYPFVTVSSGAWSTTLTRPPLTMTEMYFSVITIGGPPATGSGKKRQAASSMTSFWPVPSQIPNYPPITYMGPSGDLSTISPLDSFPTPLPSIGPNAAVPSSGAWPKQAMRAVMGNVNTPMLDVCSSPDFGCIPTPWGKFPDFIAGIIDIDGGIDPGITGQPWELEPCGPQPDVDGTGDDPDDSSSTTSSSTMTSSMMAEKTPDPAAQPNLHCYGSGKKINGDAAYNAIMQMVGALAVNIQKSGKGKRDLSSPFAGLSKRDNYDDIGEGGYYTAGAYREYSYSFSNNFYIIMSMQVKDGCEWKFNQGDAEKYLKIPIDSCNCGGANGKQGGVYENNCITWRIDPNVGQNTGGNF